MIIQNYEEVGYAIGFLFIMIIFAPMLGFLLSCLISSLSQRSFEKAMRQKEDRWK